MVTNLILINVGIYVVELLLRGARTEPNPVTANLALYSDLASRPWNFYQLLSYGFLHDPWDLWHVLANMLGLWFFGRDVELKYGRREFLSLYLSLLVLSGLAWVLVESIAPRAAQGPIPRLIGASGAVTGVLLLFAVNFPHRTVLLFLVLPMPAWVFAIILVLSDLRGALTRTGNVAYVCHLAGAALAMVYFRTGWSLQRLLPDGLSLQSIGRRAKLRIHNPPDHESNLEPQVDEILRKIQRHGQESLSNKERRLLEKASRRYREKDR
jgi:membrane associated rhomboid family serine protease